MHVGQAPSLIGSSALRQQWAYDVCALVVHQAGGPCLLLTSDAHPWWGLVARLPQATAARPEHALDGSQVMGRDFASAVWLEPRAVPEQVQRLAGLLRPGVPVVLMAFGPLARLTGERPLPGSPPGDLVGAVRTLRSRGFGLEASYGFGGPAALFLRAWAGLAEHLGAPSWADALEGRARRRFAATPARWWHPLRVVVVRAP